MVNGSADFSAPRLISVMMAHWCSTAGQKTMQIQADYSICLRNLSGQPRDALAEH